MSLRNGHLERIIGNILDMSTEDANSDWLDLSLEGLNVSEADRIRVFRLLMIEGARLRGLLDKALAPSGLTAQQGALLSWIQAQPEPPTLMGAANGLSMTHQNVKQIVVALQRKGMLDIQVDANDRRVRRLVLTEAHHRLWRDRNPSDFSSVLAWMSGWEDEEVAQMVRLLRRLHRHLDSHSGAIL